ncbi:hypothetical protein [Streptomyces sp. MBT62]|uniref:hypothetical protein n=1 Tax=Streptomyces sp. MBT62 TaxID=2800410 RepID=UPI00190C9BAA|nr:hypothetical protein [Streptomyces sp. MBT62]MBK3562693.1 hypothetical protein [Streptomyces sp. MBT62]
MTSRSVPRIDLQDIELPYERTLGTPSVAERLTGRFSFGSVVLPPAEPFVSAEWSAHAEGAGGDGVHRVLVMACTFHPETPDSPWTCDRAALGVSLMTDDPQAPPVARLIAPVEGTEPAASVPSTVSYGINVGLFNVAVTQPLPASNGPEWVVRGYGALQSRLRWDFRSTRRHPLVGDHQLAALVGLPPGRSGTAQALFSAEFRHPRLGLRRHRAQLPPTEITLSE